MYTLWFEVDAEIISITCPSVESAQVVYDALIVTARSLGARP